MKKTFVNKKVIFDATMWSVLLLTIFPTTAYAYLDPGTGSYMLQILLGVFVGALFTIKTFWKNIKKAVVNLFKRGEER